MSADQPRRRHSPSPRSGPGRHDRRGADGAGRARGAHGPRSERPARNDDRGPQRSEARPAREIPPRNPGDLRRSNSEQRGRSPEIDDDVTGKELDRAAAAQLKTLNDTNRTWVAKHLVMAGRLVDIDPALALEHAVAASRRGGRLAVVREAVGLSAYAAGDYAEALRELRTYRRISGDQTHLAVQADCERGLERPEKAIELSRSPEARQLTGAARVQLALVVAGACGDMDDHEGSLKALEIPELDINRAFSYSPDLFSAYAEALDALGRADEAERWHRQRLVAERALGAGAFEEPEIMDFDEGDSELPTVKDVMGPPAREPGARPSSEPATSGADHGSAENTQERGSR